MKKYLLSFFLVGCLFAESVQDIQTLDGAQRNRLEAIIGSGGGGGVPTTRLISAGSGLSGGGDLSADRAFSINWATTLLTNDVHYVRKSGDIMTGALSITNGLTTGPALTTVTQPDVDGKIQIWADLISGSRACVAINSNSDGYIFAGGISAPAHIEFVDRHSDWRSSTNANNTVVTITDGAAVDVNRNINMLGAKMSGGTLDLTNLTQVATWYGGSNTTHNPFINFYEQDNGTFWGSIGFRLNSGISLFGDLLGDSSISTGPNGVEIYAGPGKVMAIGSVGGNTTFGATNKIGTLLLTSSPVLSNVWTCLDPATGRGAWVPSQGGTGNALVGPTNTIDGLTIHGDGVIFTNETSTICVGSNLVGAVSGNAKVSIFGNANALTNYPLLKIVGSPMRNANILEILSNGGTTTNLYMDKTGALNLAPMVADTTTNLIFGVTSTIGQVVTNSFPLLGVPISGAVVVWWPWDLPRDSAWGFAMSSANTCSVYRTCIVAGPAYTNFFKVTGL